MSGSRRARWVVVAAAVLGVAIALVLLLAPDPGERAVAGSTTTSSVPVQTSTSAPPTTAAAATTSSSVPEITVSPGRLVVTTSALDFGSSGVLRQLRLRNPGGQPVIWSADEAVDWLTVAPGSGGISGGQEVLVGVSLDRARAPEGALSAAVSVTGPEGLVSVPVTGTVDRRPTVAGARSDAVVIFARAGPCVPETTTVSATVTDGMGVESVGLGWRTPDGQEHTTAMASAGGGVWQGELGPFHASGDVAWWISATDTSGNTMRTIDHVLPVMLCLPG